MSDVPQHEAHRRPHTPPMADPFMEFNLPAEIHRCYKAKCLSRCGVSSSGMTTRWFECWNDSGCAASTAGGRNRGGRSAERLGRARSNRDPYLQGLGIQSLHCPKPNTGPPHDAARLNIMRDSRGAEPMLNDLLPLHPRAVRRGRQPRRSLR